MTLDQQIAAVSREIALREGVYPKWVAAGKMKQEKADHELAAMKAVLESLKTLAALVHLRQIKRRIEDRTATAEDREIYKSTKETVWARADLAVGDIPRTPKLNPAAAWPFPTGRMP